MRGRSSPSSERAVVVKRQRAVGDEAHDGDRRQALDAARDPELRVDGVRRLQSAVRQAVGPGQLQLVATIDADRAGEGRLLGDPIDLVRQ